MGFAAPLISGDFCSKDVAAAVLLVANPPAAICTLEV